MPPSHHLHKLSPNALPTPGHGHTHAPGQTHAHLTHADRAQDPLAGSAQPPSSDALARPCSVLGWPAWQRLLVMLPVLLLLWLAVAWASGEVQPW